MIGRAEVERYRGCWERCGKFLKYGKLLVFFFFLMLDKAGKKKKNPNLENVTAASKL